MSKLTKKQQKVQELLEGFEQPSTGLDALKKLKEVSEAVSKFNETVEYLKQNVKENDIVLTLGAGTVTKIGPMLKDAD